MWGPTHDEIRTRLMDKFEWLRRELELFAEGAHVKEESSNYK